MPMKQNKCKYCKRSFYPSKTHPKQKCCGDKSCLRTANNARQRRFYRKSCKEDSDWKKQMSQRKKKERLRRLNSSSSDNTSTSPTFSVISASEYEPLILGVLSTLTGYRNSDDLFNIRQRCIENGRKYLNRLECYSNNNVSSIEKIEENSTISNNFPNAGPRGPNVSSIVNVLIISMLIFFLTLA